MLKFFLIVYLLLKYFECSQVYIADSFFKFEYSFPDYQHVEITMSCTTQGWVGLGIGENMMDADIIIGTYGVASIPILKDYTSISYGPPQEDVIQDVVLINHRRDKTGTSFSFRRRLKPNDMNDKEILLNEPTQLIWACGETDYINYHKLLRGAFNVSFESRHFKALTAVCHWTCKTCSGPSNQQCKTCFDNKISINGICNTSDTSYPSLYREILPNRLNIFWTFDKDYVIFLVEFVEKARNLWFGLGFGGFGMNKTDMVWFEIHGPNEIHSFDGWSNSPGKPVTDRSIGGKDDIEILGYRKLDGFNLIKFRRKIITADRYDAPILRSPMNVSFAWGLTNDINYHHTNRGKFMMYFMHTSCHDDCLICKGPSSRECFSCKKPNNILVDGSCILNNVSILRNKVELTPNEYIFSWDFNEKLFTVDMVLKVQTEFWFGIGFGGYGMDKVDMIWVEIGDNTNDVTIYDGWSTFASKPEVDSLMGGTNDLILVGNSFENGTRTLKIRRKMYTNDRFDTEIVPQPMNVSWAIGETRHINYHNAKRGVKVVDFTIPLKEVKNSTANTRNSKPAALNTTTNEVKQNVVENIQISKNVSKENISALELPKNIYQIKPNKVFMYWSFPDNKSIDITLRVLNHSGWVGLGIGLGMTKADMIWFQVKTEDNSVEAFDGWSETVTRPKLDEVLGGINNVELLGYSFENNETLIKFRRDLKTNDSLNDVEIIRNQVNEMSYAYGNSAKLGYHGAHRGRFSVNITDYKDEVLPCDQGCGKCLNGICLKCNISLILIQGHCKENDINETENKAVILNNKLSIGWEYEKKTGNHIIIRIEARHGNWFGIGIGSGMNDADMWIFEIGENGEVFLTDGWSFVSKRPSLDIDLGGKNNLELLGFKYQDGIRTIKFRRLIDTQEKFDIPLRKEELKMSYAFGSTDNMNYHGQSAVNRGLFLLDFSAEGRDLSSKPLETTTLDFLINIHGVVLIICWGFVVEAGMIIARYFRTYNQYVDVHMYLFLFADLSTIIMSIMIILQIGKRLQKISLDIGYFKGHFVIGIIILLLIILQHVGGSVLRHLLFRSNGNERAYLLKRGHQIMGITIYVLAKINLVLGLLAHHPYQHSNIWVSIVIYFCLLLCLRAFFEVQYRKNVRAIFSSNCCKRRQNSEIKAVLSMLNEKKSVEEITDTYPHQKWALFKNDLIDLNKFNHPGGIFIIDRILAREISRFIYGAYFIEDGIRSPYLHSVYAMDLLNRLTVGQMDQKLSVFMDPKGIEEDEEVIWELKSKSMISDRVAKLELKSEQFQLRNYQPGIDWFGRYFLVIPHGKAIQPRNYSFVLCMTADNIEFQNNLVSLFESKLKRDNIKPLMKKVPEYSDYLPLFIRRYNNAGLSSFMIDDEHQKYVLEGPIGLGLEISPKNEGTYYIFAGGTGILPFLDLFDFLLKKSIYEVIHKNFGISHCEPFNPFDENFLQVLPAGFKIVLFASFTDLKEFIGFPMVKKLWEISKNHGLKCFDMIIRFSIPQNDSDLGEIQTTNSHFDESFILRNVEKEQIEKIWICGPPGMMKDVPIYLEAFGVPKQKCVLL